MMKAVCAGVLVAMLFAAAMAQTQCECELETEKTGAMCSSLQIIATDSNGINLCEDTPYLCRKCVCVAGGSQMCDVETGMGLVWTLQDRFCEMGAVTYAVCPPPATSSEEQVLQQRAELKSV
eukprot:CAMPEP_0185850754 /NCGR_PEP_ID=MMETSP1354-20130828/4771_1 /TAXON_ID=708628 /ORGANISM="Erythrolobus madagascarensis, Strain CCMP3276" /LENGTH=121 /DNA_ID=CAMNT_0028551471 /DNA_START=73 /DNA_END=438 /DNA_ORIENTATION=-